MSLEQIRIPVRILSEMRAHAESGLPYEVCGLLGGKGGVVSVRIPVTNSLSSPVEFRMEPREQLAAFIQLESQQLDLLAIYHSHPGGPEHPSAIDLERHLYPHAAAVILAKNEPEWGIQAYWIRNARYGQVELIGLA
jgi:proteasome lid subunit RPN8/RPN11